MTAGATPKVTKKKIQAKKPAAKAGKVAEIADAKLKQALAPRVIQMQIKLSVELFDPLGRVTDVRQFDLVVHQAQFDRTLKSIAEEVERGTVGGPSPGR